MAMLPAQMHGLAGSDCKAAAALLPCCLLPPQHVPLLLLLQGWASAQYPDDLQAAAAQGMAPLLDAIVQHVPPPSCDPEAPFAMCVAMIDRDPYLGRIATGAVQACLPLPCWPACRGQDNGCRMMMCYALAARAGGPWWALGTSWPVPGLDAHYWHQPAALMSIHCCIVCCWHV
jgi:hypothetical protein